MKNKRGIRAIHFFEKKTIPTFLSKKRTADEHKKYTGANYH